MKIYKTKKQPSKIRPIKLQSPDASAIWLEEPELLFANGKTNTDPKVGIPLYGPRSYGTSRHKREIHCGFIGMGKSVEKAQEFLADCAEGIDGDISVAPFPGFASSRGFYSELLFDDKIVELLTTNETKEIIRIGDDKLRFEKLLSLFEMKLTILTQKDHPLDYIFLILTQELYEACRVTDYQEKGVGEVHRDLRHAFKALAMGFKVPTQILLENTILSKSSPGKKLDHKAKIAWNLCSGLYFKVGGLPWGPTGLAPDSCFVGVSFFRPLGAKSTLRTSVVQAFDENGEGLILRGHDFNWSNKEKRSPHLTEDMASSLIEMVLNRYTEERGSLPKRVVLHKSSGFEEPERKGFEAALSGIDRFDLLALSPTSDVRLLRLGKYPPLRGTAINIGKASYLYTNGYISDLASYPHGHVPSPLQITDHIGDSPLKLILSESMTLTKMNWNSADFSGLMPITLRFSRLVGDILREVADKEPEPQYKYYM